MALRIVVSEALEAWREAEQLLRLLPATSEERGAVSVTQTRLRELYRTLTEDRAMETAELLKLSHATIADARAVLDAARQKVALTSGPNGSGTEPPAVPRSPQTGA